MSLWLHTILAFMLAALAKEIRVVAAVEFDIDETMNNHVTEVDVNSASGDTVDVTTDTTGGRLTNSSGRQHRSKKDKDGIWTVLAVIGFLIILCGGGIGWCLYLECQPAIRCTRYLLVSALALLTVANFGACTGEYFHWWILPAVVMVNILGPLDALLRFPVVHGFSTLFPWKQISLLVLKAAIYICGDCTSSANKIVLLAALLLDCIAFPLMYLFALPYHEVQEEQSLLARGIVDVDIAVRVGRLIVDSNSRHESALECKRLARASALTVASACPAAGRLLCRLDPHLQSAMRKDKLRSV